MTEQEYLSNINEGYEAALRVLSLADIDDENDELYMDAAELVYHCEVCTLREILQAFWPPVQEYIDWLRSEAGLDGEAIWR